MEEVLSSLSNEGLEDGTSKLESVVIEEYEMSINEGLEDGTSKLESVAIEEYEMSMKNHSASKNNTQHVVLVEMPLCVCVCVCGWVWVGGWL